LSADGPGPADSDALEAAIARLTDVVDSLKRLFELRVERARVEIREKIFGIVGWLLLSILLISMIATAVPYGMRGLSGMIVAWSGRAWAGDLAVGSLTLALVAIVGLSVLLGARRSNLSRMRAKLGDADSPGSEKT